MITEIKMRVTSLQKNEMFTPWDGVVIVTACAPTATWPDRQIVYSVPAEHAPEVDDEILVSIGVPS